MLITSRQNNKYGMNMNLGEDNFAYNKKLTVRGEQENREHQRLKGEEHESTSILK